MGWLETLKLALQSFIAIRSDIQGLIKWHQDRQEKIWQAQSDALFGALQKQGLLKPEEKDAKLRDLNDLIKRL